MKNKKKLLIAVAAMGLLAVGTAGVGTAAWFTASSSVNVTPASNTASLTVDSSTYDAGTFYVQASAALGTDKVDLTDFEGKCWVISNGYLRTASVKYAQYTTLTISVGFYTDAECTVPVSDAGDLANIGAKYDYVTVTINPDANTRLTATNPSSSTFAAAFSGKLDANDTVQANLSTAGAVTSYATNPHYISVNGDGNAEAGSSHSDGQTGQSNSTTNGGVALTCVLHAR